MRLLRVPYSLLTVAIANYNRDADGSEWFVTRPNLGPIPLFDDLDAASSFVKKFTDLQETLKTYGAMGEEAADSVWATFVSNTTYTDSRVLKGALRHDDPGELLRSLQNDYSNNVTAARIEDSRRSLDWLRERGTCGDHIIGRPSTLAQAGMGAFATRTIPAGTVVAQLPMIHVTNRSRFDMYALHVNVEGDWVPVNETVTGQQLLLNYCYGHGESSLLLCPYGPMVNYVNHNQSAANIRLVWGRAETGNHMPELLESSVVALAASDARAKLAMEFIALREIAAGEEILLDYGDEWEAAWKAHVARWQPVADAATHVSAAQLDADETRRLRTVFEEIDDETHPDNVELQCDAAFLTGANECAKEYKAGTLETYLWQADEAWWPCAVLRYRMDDSTGDYLYTVHLFERDNTEKIINSHLVKDVPRAGFHFVDKPYTSDVFLPNAFRHDIRIPDAIFPRAWRN